MPFQQTVPSELWETVESLKGIYGMPSSGGGVNQEQIDFITKTFGIATGFQPYDLSSAAYYLIPTFSPLRNRLPRLHLQGSNMEFKSVTNPDTGNTPGLVAEGQAPTTISTQTADVITQFKQYGIRSDPVTYAQLFAGAGKAGDFNVDSRAIAAANLLKALFIKEERLILGGVGASAQIATTTTSPNNGFDFTIGGAIGAAPAGGTLTAQTTGGTIGASVAVDVQYVAVSSYAIATGMGTVSGSIAYSTSTGGQSLPQTADLTTTVSSGTTNSVLFTPPSGSTVNGKPIIGWVVYVGDAGSTGAHYYFGFTAGAPLTITSVPTSGQQTPTTDNSYGTVSGGTGSSVEGAFNGIIPWILGTGSGATITAVNAKPTLDTYQNAFQSAFSSAFADPDMFLVSPADLNYLTNLLTGTNGGQPYWFAANQGTAQGNMTAGFRVSRFINPVTSRELSVDVHAYLPAGTALALTMQLPAWYVGNNVPDTWIWGGSMDYLEIDYQPAPNYVNYVSDILCLGGIHCFLPSQNLIWTGLATS